MRLTAIFAAAALCSGAAFADTIAPGDVQYADYGEVETSLTGVAGDPANGRDLMIARGKGNCLACHEIPALNDAPFHGEVGPILEGVASYRTEAELRGIVANAKMTFDGTVMPAFYKSTGYIRPGDGYTGKAAKGDLPPILSAQEVEDIVAFLMTLQDS